MRPSLRAPIALAAALLVLAAAAGAEPVARAVWAARALAGLGLYALARELGLRPAAAALAAAAHALAPPVSAAGSLPAAAWLPWVLLGLERGRRGSAASGSALAVLAQAALVASPEPSAALAGSLAALAWCLAGSTRGARGARRGLAALTAGTVLAVVLGAGPGWPVVAQPLPRLDLASLGGTLVAGAVVVRARPRPGERAWRARAAVPALAAVLLAAWLARRGLEPRAAELFAPGLLPPRAGAALPAIPVPGLGLALALLLGGDPREPRQRRLAAFAAVALLLALAAPGVGDLWRLTPLLGRVEPAGAAGAATLFLALAAGAALESAAPAARSSAALALVGLGALAWGAAWRAPGPPLDLPVDRPDEVLSWSLLEAGRVEGQLDPGLPAARLRLYVLPLDAARPGRAVEGAPGPASGPGGRRPFELELEERLAPGRWLAVLELADAEGEPMAERVLGLRFVRPGPRALAAAALALGLALALLVPARTRAARWAAALAVALAGLAGY